MGLDRRNAMLLKFNLNAEGKCPMLQLKLPDRSDDAGRRVLASIRPYNRHWGSAVLQDPQVFPLPALDASGPHGSNGRIRSSSVSDAVR